jgi:putative transposase
MKDPFVEGAYYHIFNRANGSENLFREDTNYKFFMNKYFQYMEPVVETFAFCLMKNHFHILIRVRDDINMTVFSDGKVSADVNRVITQQFSRLFNSYAKAYNLKYRRRGSLFQTNIKRKRIHQADYLQNLVLYIHHNPAKDGFVKRFDDWLYSSWSIYAGHEKTKWHNEFIRKINLHETIEWFGDIENFTGMHQKFNYRSTNSVFDVRNESR